jgi:hypothetical protein
VRVCSAVIGLRHTPDRLVLPGSQSPGGGSAARYGAARFDRHGDPFVPRHRTRRHQQPPLIALGRPERWPWRLRRVRRRRRTGLRPGTRSFHHDAQHGPCRSAVRGFAGRKKLTFNSRVGANSPSGKVATRAGPSVSSSIAAKNPPWTLPIGLVNSWPAAKRTSISPCSGTTETSSHPNVAAAGGRGTRPSTASQKGPDRCSPKVTPAASRNAAKRQPQRANRQPQPPVASGNGACRRRYSVGMSNGTGSRDLRRR